MPFANGIPDNQEKGMPKKTIERLHPTTLTVGATLQKLPLLRLAVMLILGLIVGYALHAIVATQIWLIATATTFLSSVILYRHAVAQSIFILLCTFFLGAFLLDNQLETIEKRIPEGFVEYEGVIISEPIDRPKTVRCDILITSMCVPTDSGAIDTIVISHGMKARAYFHNDEYSQRLSVGEGFKASSAFTSASQHSRSLYFNDFDYGRYLVINGFSATTFISADYWQGAAVSLSSLSIIQRTKIKAMQLRAQLLQRYSQSGIDGQELAVLSALTLGDKSLLTAETRDDYSQSGASHILALSGLHLTIIYAILTLLAGRMRRKLVVVVLTTLSIWAFVFISGMSSSVTRAAIMLTMYAFCDMLNRGRPSLNTLSFAAIAILVADPLALYNVGFELSFMAMLSIGMFYRPFMSCLSPTLLRLWLVRAVLSMTAVSLAAQIGTAPLVAFYFGRLPLYSLITNIIVVVGATVVLYGAVFFFISTPLTALQDIIADGLSHVLRWMNMAVAHIASLPGNGVLDFQPSQLQVLMVYLVIFAAYRTASVLHRVYTYGRQIGF